MPGRPPLKAARKRPTRLPAARRREPARKRERLLEAARSLFAERGYAATTTAQLAREAGVAEGTVFHHFASKRALLEAVAGEYGRGLAERMFAGVDATASEPAAEPMLRRAFAYVREQGALSRLLVLAPDPTEWDAARAANRREIVSALAAAFTQLAGARGSARVRSRDRRRAAVRARRGRPQRVLRARGRIARGGVPARDDRLRRGSAVRSFADNPTYEEFVMSRAFGPDPFLRGNYAPLLIEGEAFDLPIEGELPRELHGTLYRNGPNPQFAPRGRYHWFDGDGMIHAFRLRDGRASYRNRWVRTTRFALERAAGEALFGGLGDLAAGDPRVAGATPNAANTNIVWHAGRLLALWEGGPPHALDPVTLETLGPHDFARQARRRHDGASEARSRDR